MKVVGMEFNLEGERGVRFRLLKEAINFQRVQQYRSWNSKKGTDRPRNRINSNPCDNISCGTENIE